MLISKQSDSVIAVRIKETSSAVLWPQWWTGTVPERNLKIQKVRVHCTNVHVFFISVYALYHFTATMCYVWYTVGNLKKLSTNMAWKSAVWRWSKSRKSSTLYMQYLSKKLPFHFLHAHSNHVSIRFFLSFVQLAACANGTSTLEHGRAQLDINRPCST